MNDPLRHGMPPDPFAGDPDDPAAELAELDPVDDGIPSGPLDADERRAIEEDLADLAEFRRLLAPIGVKGVAVQCEDCAEEHYHEWDMLRANLMQLLEDGSLLPHEPAFDPIPDDYVTWEYCRGYSDAVRALRPRRLNWRR
ncbi:MAG: DUF5319 domain-containing protein [Dietzia sp.]